MKIGLICESHYYGSPEDKFLSGNGGLGLSSFYFAMKNIFNDCLIVKSHNDLHSIDIVLIPNYHWQPHRDIWQNYQFREICNNKNILCIFWSAEQILSPHFPWNVDLEYQIDKFNNNKRVVYDVNDAKVLKRSFSRIPISKEYEFLKINNVKRDKTDRIVFIGNLSLPAYQRRVETLNELDKHIKYDIYPNRCISTTREYFDVMSQYKYVLNLHSTNFNGITIRFYDALLMNSIPVQQVYSDTLEFFPEEKNYKNAIFFENINELIEKLNSQTDFDETQVQPWLENDLMKFFENEIGYNF